MKVFREWWMRSGSMAVQVSLDYVLFFDLDTKLHQFNVKRILSFNGNFNRYNDRSESLFTVTKKKGKTILAFFQMLENQSIPGTVEKTFDISSREYRKIFRRGIIEENFELTRSEVPQRELEENFERYRGLMLLEVEEIIETDPGALLLEDFEENFEDADPDEVEDSFDLSVIGEKTGIRNEIEDSFDTYPDVLLSGRKDK